MEKHWVLIEYETWWIQLKWCKLLEAMVSKYVFCVSTSICNELVEVLLASYTIWSWLSCWLLKIWNHFLNYFWFWIKLNYLFSPQFGEIEISTYLRISKNQSSASSISLNAYRMLMSNPPTISQSSVNLQKWMIDGQKMWIKL